RRPLPDRVPVANRARGGDVLARARALAPLRTPGPLRRLPRPRHARHRRARGRRRVRLRAPRVPAGGGRVRLPGRRVAAHPARAPSIAPRAVAVGFAELYNDWIWDWCRRGRGRLHGVAVLPIEYVEDAIAVLRRAKERGLVCAMVPPALKTRNLDHPDLDPLYA